MSFYAKNACISAANSYQRHTSVALQFLQTF